MTPLLRGAACASLLALVAGCCANSVNNCDDLYADSLYLVLKSKPNPNVPNDKSYFSAAELDTVYIQRYTPAQPAKPATSITPPIAAQPEGTRSAPVAIVRNQPRTAVGLNIRLEAAGLTDSVVVVISNTTPFTPSTAGTKLNAYNYVITVQDRTTTPRQTYEYVITDIVLRGKYEADGCTTCYENTGKTFQLNKRGIRRRIVTATEDPATTVINDRVIKIPKPIRISKLD